MSTTIDSKVVEMRFDNKQFEAGVQQTVSSISKLNDSFGKMESSGYEAGFSLKDVIAKTFSVAEWQAARALVDGVTSSVKSLADQMLGLTAAQAGFSEYELKMGSIQTIMASTGEDLETVNGYLNELNEYSDKTIYSFSDMTSNIGKFTNAGVSLKDSVAAIQGVANVAALSGANSNEASRAMYNFSQALSAGYVKLIDWKSIENANMATVGFKEELIKTAVSLGTVTKEADGTYKTLSGNTFSATKNFNEVLQDQWMTSEVLTQTLANYSDETTEIGAKATQAATEVKTFSQMMDTLKESAQSGWAQTWELIFGDFEEGKALWTDLNEIFGGIIEASSESRNALLEDWKALGGREHLYDSLMNLIKAIGSIVKPIKDAFSEIFPPATAQTLFDLTEGIKKFTEGLILSDDAAYNLKRIFKGLFAVFDIGKELISAVFKGVSSLFGGVEELSGGVLEVTGSFADWIVNVRDFIKENDIFNKVVQTIAGGVNSIVSAVKKVVKVLKDKFVSPGLERLGIRLGQIGEATGAMKDGIVKSFQDMGDALRRCAFFKLIEATWNAIKTIGSGIAKAFSILTGKLFEKISNINYEGVLDFLNTLSVSGIALMIAKFIKGLSDIIEPIGSFKDGLKDIVGGIKDVLGGAKNALADFSMSLKSETLKKLATAIAILAAALFVISLIDSDKLAASLGSVAVLFTELIGAMGALNKLGIDWKVSLAAGALTKIASALLTLSIALKLISTIEPNQLFVSLVAIGVALAALVTAVKMLPQKDVRNAAKAISKLSSSLVVMAIAIKILSTISWQDMLVALGGMAVGLAAMVGAVNLLPGPKVNKGAKAISKLSSSLVVMAIAIKILSTISWQDMLIGLGGMVVGLAAMVGAVNLLPKDMAARTFGITAAATAILILSAAMKILSTMSWESMAIGLVALAGSLGVLVLALNLMSNALPGAWALMVATAALMALAPVLMLLGTMSWESIIKGLVSIGGAFLILGVAGYTLGPVVGIIAALAGAIALIGVGVLAAGVGLMALGAGLTSLSIGITAFVASIGSVLTGIIAIITAVIVGILEGIANGIVAFCGIITDGASAICEAVTAVLTSILNAIIEVLPALGECIRLLITEVLRIIVECTPKLVEAVCIIIVQMLQGIADYLPAILEAAVNLIGAFLRGIGEQVPRVVDAAIDMIVRFINGLAKGIVDNTKKMIDAVNNLMSAVFEAIGMYVGNIPKLGKQLIQGFVKGIKASAGDLWNAVVGVVKDAWNGVLKFLGIKSPSRLAAEAGMFIDEGLAIGLEKYSDVADKAAKNLGKDTMGSLRDAISNASDSLNGDIDTQPTIAPVLDLSNVKSGAAAIDGMLNSGASVGVHANVGSISSMMNRRNQNGANDDVVSELSKLNKKLDNVKSETITINGVTYDDGSNIVGAVKEIVRAARIERRA